MSKNYKFNALIVRVSWFDLCFMLALDPFLKTILNYFKIDISMAGDGEDIQNDGSHYSSALILSSVVYESIKASR